MEDRDQVYQYLKALEPALNASITKKHADIFLDKANKALAQYDLYFDLFGDSGLTIQKIPAGE